MPSNPDELTRWKTRLQDEANSIQAEICCYRNKRQTTLAVAVVVWVALGFAAVAGIVVVVVAYDRTHHRVEDIQLEF